MNEHVDIPQEVARIVRKYAPDAEVILYGSRARGDARPDSDWDFKVIVEDEIVPQRWYALRDETIDLEIGTGQEIFITQSTRKSWDDPVTKAMPFHRNVTSQGVRL